MIGAPKTGPYRKVGGVYYAHNKGKTLLRDKDLSPQQGESVKELESSSDVFLFLLTKSKYSALYICILYKT